MVCILSLRGYDELVTNVAPEPCLLLVRMSARPFLALPSLLSCHRVTPWVLGVMACSFWLRLPQYDPLKHQRIMRRIVVLGDEQCDLLTNSKRLGETIARGNGTSGQQVESLRLSLCGTTN